MHEECVVVDLTFKEHKLQQMAPGERYPRSMAPLRKAAARILAAHRAKLLRSLALEERRALEAERRKEAGGGGDGEGDAPTSRSSRAPLHRGESFDIGVEQAAARSLEAMSRGGSRRAGSRSQHRREEEDVEEVEERPETPFDASQAPSKTPKIPPIPLLSQHTTIPRWGKVHAGSVSARLPNEPERRPPARSGKNKSLVTEALITHRYEEQSRRRSDGVAPADGGEEPGSRTPSITAQYVMLQMASRAAQARARGPTSHTGPMNGLTLHGIEDLPRSVKDVRAQLTARRCMPTAALGPLAPHCLTQYSLALSRCAQRGAGGASGRRRERSHAQASPQRQARQPAAAAGPPGQRRAVELRCSVGPLPHEPVLVPLRTGHAMYSRALLRGAPRTYGLRAGRLGRLRSGWLCTLQQVPVGGNAARLRPLWISCPPRALDVSRQFHTSPMRPAPPNSGGHGKLWASVKERAKQVVAEVRRYIASTKLLAHDLKISTSLLWDGARGAEVRS